MKDFIRRLRNSTFYQFRTDQSYEAKVGSGKPPSFKQVFVGLKVFTTLHGVPQIGRARGNPKKVLWVCVFLACVCGFAYNLAMLTMRYREFLVLTEVRLLHNNTLPFPAVTICNTNPIRSSQVHTNPHLVALLESWGLVVENGTVRRLKRRAKTGLNIPVEKHRVRINRLQQDVVVQGVEKKCQESNSCGNSSGSVERLARAEGEQRKFPPAGILEPGRADGKTGAEIDERRQGLGTSATGTLRRNKRGPGTPRCIDKCKGEGDGFYQACDTCTQYYHCTAGQEYKLTCPSAMEWDSGVNECVCSSTTCPKTRTFCRFVPPTSCVETFVYGGVEHNVCTLGSYPWCSMHYIYIGSWAYCTVECDEITNMECRWSPPNFCLIPFSYSDVTYHQCSLHGSNVPWCLFNSDVTDEEWGHCQYTCEEQDACRSYCCQNGGTCTVEGASPTCLCTEDFAGDFCEMNKVGTISLILADSVTKDEAKSACISQGDSYRLADIESGQELQTAMDNYQCTSGFSQAWLGLVRIDGTWTWEQDGRPAFSDGQWSFWGGTEPNDNLDCARIRYSDGGFGDMTCTKQYDRYFCEGDFVDPCDPNPCVNGGTCCVINYAASCACPDDFSGDICDQEPSRGYSEHSEQSCSGSMMMEYSMRSARRCSWQCNLRTECEAFVFSRRHQTCTLQLECEEVNLEPAEDQTTYITTGEKTTHTVFRVARGSPFNTEVPVLYDLWEGQDPLPSLEEAVDPSYVDVTEAATHTFKSPIVDCAWEKVEVVKASFYSGGQEVMYMLFNSSGVDKMSWFAPEYLLATSFTDLIGTSTNYFSIQGAITYKRRWYVSHVWGLCLDDRAWSMVLDSDHQTTCNYENVVHNPTFLYSQSGDRSNSFYEAEVFIIEAQLDEREFGDSCFSSCKAVEDGFYQSCLSCDIYVSCTSNVLQYLMCNYGLLYDNTTKQCGNQSTTCSGSSAYGVCLDVPQTTEEQTTTEQRTTTAAQTTTVLETTAATTTTVLESTAAETTTVLETTTAESTTVLETTAAETTTVLETTAAKTTTVSESTAIETTTVLETMAAETTTGVETTAAESTTVLETTAAETTTIVETTASESTTVLETTTTESSAPLTTISIADTEFTTLEGNTPQANKDVTDSGLTEDFTRQEELMQVLAEMDDTERAEMGYTESMILGCLYEGQVCTESDFLSFFDAVYGTCHVYNAGWKNSNRTSTLMASKPGSRYGLQVILEIGQEEYLPIVGETAGVVVVVHKNTEMAFPEEEGVFALPGRSTDIAVRMTDITRKPAPFSDCTEDVRQNMTRNVYEELYFAQYNIYACYKTCYQRYVVDVCHCGDPQYPVNGLAFGGNNKPCDIRNSTERECKKKVIGLYNSGSLECDCPTPCHQQQFKYRVSSVLWPSDVHKDSIEELLTSKLGLFESTEENDRSKASNLVRVQVYFENFNYEYLNEVPKYRLSKLFTSIGGMIGLWLGCSILSILEVLELGLDLMVLSVYKCRYIQYWAHTFWKVPQEKPPEQTERRYCRVCGTELSGSNSMDDDRLCSLCEDEEPYSPTSTGPSFVDIAGFAESRVNSVNRLTSLGDDKKRQRRKHRKVKPDRSHDAHTAGDHVITSCRQCTSYWRNK